ncbi:unnamed protein product, partial [Rotaria magnacalcarata]
MIDPLSSDHLNLNIQINVNIILIKNKNRILPNTNFASKPKITVRKTPLKEYHMIAIEQSGSSGLFELIHKKTRV